MPAKKEAATATLEPTTALAVLEPVDTDVTPARAAYNDSPVFDQDDIAYPKLKLLQGISPEVMELDSNLRAGQWYITGEEAGRKEVTFIPSLFNLSRRYTIGTKEDQTLLCTSADGVQGTAVAPGGPGRACKGCPMNAWQEDPETGRRSLPCQPSYNYVGYIPDFGVAGLSLSRTATQTAKTLNGYLQIRGFNKFAVKLTANLVKAADKAYYVPNMKLSKPDEEDLENARLLMGN
jgi:hypothetical protein